MQKAFDITHPYKVHPNGDPEHLNPILVCAHAYVSLWPQVWVVGSNQESPDMYAP
jgi:hypothetical protein